MHVPYVLCICTLSVHMYQFYQLSRAKEENQEVANDYSHLQSRLSTVIESNSLQVITLEQKV